MYKISFSKGYWNDVFLPFLEGYQTGVETPNPDVHCNRFIKFQRFQLFAKTLGADKIATGHYARIKHDDQGDKLFFLNK